MNAIKIRQKRRNHIRYSIIDGDHRDEFSRQRGDEEKAHMQRNADSEEI